MPRRTAPLCAFCKHDDEEHMQETLELRCAAFPEGIPEEILWWNNGPFYDHREPHPNDNGLQFEKLNDLELLRQRQIFNNAPDMDYIDRRLAMTFDKLDRGRLRGYIQPPLRSVDGDGS